MVGEVSSDQLPKLPVTSISMADKNLVLGYSFNWEGNAVEAVITLTPAPKGRPRRRSISRAARVRDDRIHEERKRRNNQLQEGPPLSLPSCWDHRRNHPRGL